MFTTILDTRWQTVLRSFSALVAALSLGALTAPLASAQVLYATGFEPSPANPAWTTGHVNGQNSWSAIDTSSPTGSGSTVNADQAFQVVTAPVASFTGPGGTETIPAFDGTQMVSSSTTYNAINSATTTYINHAYDNLQTLWDGRTTGKNVVEASAEIYLPSVDSSLAGLNGLALFGGASGLTNLANVTLSNNTSNGNVVLVLNPAIGSATEATSATYPNRLKRDTWVNLTTFANYNNGSISVQVNGLTLLTSANAFDTSKDFYGAELYNVSSTADTASAYAFEDDYTVTATAPAPNALPIFASGLIAVTPWIRRCRRNRAKR